MKIEVSPILVCRSHHIERWTFGGQCCWYFKNIVSPCRARMIDIAQIKTQNQWLNEQHVLNRPISPFPGCNLIFFASSLRNAGNRLPLTNTRSIITKRCEDKPLN